MKQFIALDIGGTALKYGIVNEDGSILESLEHSVNFDNYETPIIQTIINVLDRYQSDYTKFSGIAVSATGQIDSKLGKVIGVGGNIKNYLNTNIKETLENRYKIRCEVLNDANAVAAAEKWIGAAKNCRNVIAITIGTGVGGGIYVDNQLLLGQRGIAGEIGHFSIHSHGVKCSCGNVGCFEKYASMRALVEKVNTALNVEYNGKIIFENIHDVTVSKIVDEWITDIAKGIVSLVHIFNPEMIVIGGGVSKQEKLFVEPLRKKIQNIAMPRFSENLEIVGAKLENGAGMVGAVYYFISQAT